MIRIATKPRSRRSPGRCRLAPARAPDRKERETAMVRSRVLLSAIFASVALAGCAAPFSRGYYAGGYPYGIHGYYCGEWSVWPGVKCVDVGPPERVYLPPADP